MITLGQPFFGDSLFRRTFVEADLERKRRDTLADEAVLVAPDENISLRLEVGLCVTPISLATAEASAPRSDSSRP